MQYWFDSQFDRMTNTGRAVELADAETETTAKSLGSSDTGLGRVLDTLFRSHQLLCIFHACLDRADALRRQADDVLAITWPLARSEAHVHQDEKPSLPLRRRRLDLCDDVMSGDASLQCPRPKPIAASRDFPPSSDARQIHRRLTDVYHLGRSRAADCWC